MTLPTLLDRAYSSCMSGRPLELGLASAKALLTAAALLVGMVCTGSDHPPPALDAALVTAGSGGAAGSGGGGIAFSMGGAIPAEVGHVPSFDVCGNSVRSADEVCDDGNTVSGDGCSGDCKTVEPGWRCRMPGNPCTPVCGDGLLVGGETCDDGNTTGGEGCSNICQVEPGYVCPLPGQPCVKSACAGSQLDTGSSCDAGAPFVPVCGDGIVTPDEECDCGDGGVPLPAKCPGPNNDTTYGGCTTTCTYGAYCGDGLANGDEDCDLGEQNGQYHDECVYCTTDCRIPPCVQF